MVKMTFTFDEETVDTLRRTASRLKKPQSVVVREAIQDYAERGVRLSDEERQRMLDVLDLILSRPGTRKPTEVDAEIADLRVRRRTGGRRNRPA